jgi:hypothetical protein
MTSDLALKTIVTPSMSESEASKWSACVLWSLTLFVPSIMDDAKQYEINRSAGMRCSREETWILFFAASLSVRAWMAHLISRHEIRDLKSQPHGVNWTFSVNSAWNRLNWTERKWFVRFYNGERCAMEVISRDLQASTFHLEIEFYYGGWFESSACTIFQIKEFRNATMPVTSHDR